MPDIDVEQALRDLGRDPALGRSGAVEAPAYEVRRRGDRRRRISVGLNTIGALAVVALLAGMAVFFASGRPTTLPAPVVTPSPSPTTTALRLAPLDGYPDGTGTVLLPPTTGRGTQELGPVQLRAGQRLRIWFTCLPSGKITLTLDKEFLVGTDCGYPTDSSPANGLSSVGGVGLPVPGAAGASSSRYIVVHAGADVTWSIVVQVDP